MKLLAPLTTTDTLLERVHLLPDELVALDQWVLWRQEADDNDKATKRPYRAAQPGRRAEHGNPETWAPFAVALDAFADHLDKPGRFDGIGFVFTPEDPFTGIDFDDCREGDTVLPAVLEVITKLGGYCEISPSQTGLKLWTRTAMPVPKGQTGFTRKGLFGCSKVEVYRSHRYFTTTGWRMDQ